MSDDRPPEDRRSEDVGVSNGTTEHSKSATDPVAGSAADVFDRELRKLYHAELEILELHGDLAAAAASDDVAALFDGHRADTVEQIHRIERVFEHRGEEPAAEDSPIMVGILAEKDALVDAAATDDLRDLDVVSTGMINERFEITILDRLLLLAAELELPSEIVTALETNRREANAALSRMEAFVERR